MENSEDRFSPNEAQVILLPLKKHSDHGVHCLQIEPPHDKTNKMTVRPAKTQISLGICPVWPIFAVHAMGSQGPKLSSCGQRRLWSDWADAQADLSLRWVHMPFCLFFMMRLNYRLVKLNKFQDNYSQPFGCSLFFMFTDEVLWLTYM